MKNKLTLWILITTMNSWIERVKKELLPQLKNVDEVIISHQITDKNILPEEWNLWEKVKYFYMYDKWLSKNRNNAIKNSTSDICYICDDDLNLEEWFEEIIKNEYLKSDFDIITFQAINEKWEKHFKLKKWEHNILSVLKIWSWWITFKRDFINKNNLTFDENFWLGTLFPTWEENIFLMDLYKKWAKMYHSNKPIVFHPDESSWINYNKDLIIARIKVFKRLFWFVWWIAWIFYFTVLHYKYYKWKFSVLDFFILSFKSLVNAE